MPTSDSNYQADRLTNELGDCPRCSAIFALPAPSAQVFDTIQCPECQERIPLGAIKSRIVSVAKPAVAETPQPVAPIQVPVELPVEAPAAEVPAEPFKLELPELKETPSVPEPVAKETVSAKPVAADPGLESLDEWLRRTTGVSATTPAAEPTSVPTPPVVEEPVAKTTQPTVADETAASKKKSLSDTLGWTPGSFSIETEDDAPVAKSVTPKLPAATNEPAPFNAKATVSEIDSFADSLQADEPAKPSVDDFQFDFKKALLETEKLAQEEPAGNFGAELAGVGATTSEFENSSSSSKKRSGWGAPLSALAGLLVVGGASYYALDYLSNEPIASDTDNMAFSTPDKPSPLSNAFGVNSSVERAGYDEAIDSTVETPVASQQPAGDRYSQAGVTDRYAEANSPSSETSVVDSPPVEGELSYTEQASYNAEEPSAFAEQPLLEQVLPAQPVQRLIGAPAYGLADLEPILKDSEVAGNAFMQGTLTNPEQAQQMGKLYGDLCYQAQLLTLLDTQDMSHQLKNAEMLSVDVYRRMFQELKTVQEINQVAQHWINWTGRPYGGVFFAGVPNEKKLVGDLYQYQFPLGDSFVYVVTEEPIDVARFVASNSRLMGVIGVVVEQPRERIAGYEGDAERVIWCRKTIPLGGR